MQQFPHDAAHPRSQGTPPSPPQVGEEVLSWLAAQISCQSISQSAAKLATILSSEVKFKSVLDNGRMAFLGPPSPIIKWTLNVVCGAGE